jgi:hypothetical protein
MELKPILAIKDFVKCGGIIIIVVHDRMEKIEFAL